MRYMVFGRPTGLRASYLILGTGTFDAPWRDGAEPHEVRRMGPVRKCRSEISLGRDRETQMSDYALSSRLSERSCRTRQPAAWPSSQRQMFATVSW
jgi:hypothetical protein